MFHLMFAAALKACFFVAWALVFSGCEQNAAPAGPEGPQKCSSVGQRCEYSPGKLGSCVLRDDCRGSDCYVCQSQH